MTKEQAKLLIEDYESFTNGLYLMKNADVKVANVKLVRKGAEADVVYLENGKELDRDTNCFYSLQLLKSLERN